MGQLAQKKTTKEEFSYGTGRRKTSSARVYLRKGTGIITVNGRSLEEYFNRKTAHIIVRNPFEVTGMQNCFDVTVKVAGGGTTGQAGAILHGIARALIQHESTLKPVLRKAGYVTRDARETERKKVGLHKARRKRQFSKR